MAVLQGPLKTLKVEFDDWASVADKIVCISGVVASVRGVLLAWLGCSEEGSIEEYCEACRNLKNVVKHSLEWMVRLIQEKAMHVQAHVDQAVHKVVRDVIK